MSKSICKKKWVLCCTYNPKTSLISKHLNEIGKNLDLLLSKYDNIMLIGDFNAEPTEATVSDFCEIYNLKHLMKDKTCFKNPTKPTCNDLIITNRAKCFQDSAVIETGLSDFHKMSATVMKMYYTYENVMKKPSVVRYRKFKNFCNDSFIKDIELLLSKLCNQQNVPFKILKELVNITLDKHAPLKKRYVRANQSAFMNKKSSKEIMKRSRLRNKFLNTKSDIDRKAYNKQRNYLVSLLRNGKKNFYSSLDTKVVTDNRTFCKTVKPLLSEKVTKHSKINLVEDDKIISCDDQIAKKFSEYFINIPILNMPSNSYKCPDSSEQDPILKILDKYKNHPSIKLIKAKNNSQVFKFSQIDIEEVKKSFQSLDRKKPHKRMILNQSTKEKYRLFCKVHM